VVGLSTDDASNTLHQLLELELLVGVVAVLAAIIATTFGVRRSLRKLHRVTRLAWEVSADVSDESGGLRRRVPTSDMYEASEVGKLATSVNTLLGAVQTQVAERVRSERRMREFLLDASHELRTPLTSIRGYAELARMYRRTADTTDPASAQVGDALHRIEAEGVRMSSLVEDLLSLARTDEGVPLHIEPIDINELVTDAATSARAAFPTRRIEAFTGPYGATVNGDRGQLLRVLTNLLANAATHTDPNGPIRITVQPTGQTVVIQVADSGPGLTPEDAARIFDRFWRADKSRVRASGGTGLGMSIVAATIAQHRGTVRFDSTVAAGSTATITLPAEAR
jgi:two-component system OmpR family sensor kinase